MEHKKIATEGGGGRADLSITRLVHLVLACACAGAGVVRGEEGGEIHSREP